MHYSTIFQQLFNFIPKHRVEKFVEKLSGDRTVGIAVEYENWTTRLCVKSPLIQGLLNIMIFLD